MMSPTLKARLNAREKLFGFFVGIPVPAVIEMIGYVGFDFVIIDAEHGPMDLSMIENMLRAADASDLHAVVRVPGAVPEIIQYVLDLGAEGILVPHVTDAAKAEAIVKAAYYPPLGSRGVSTVARAARFGTIGAKQFIGGRAGSTAVIAMIEDAAALPNVEEIGRVEGIDALFIGPNDLSTSMGHVGDLGHPEVAAAIAGICEAGSRIDGLTVATLGGDPARVKELHGMGATMLMYSPVKILMTGLKALRSDLDAL